MKRAPSVDLAPKKRPERPRTPEPPPSRRAMQAAPSIVETRAKNVIFAATRPLLALETGLSKGDGGGSQEGRQKKSGRLLTPTC